MPQLSYAGPAPAREHAVIRIAHRLAQRTHAHVVVRFWREPFDMLRERINCLRQNFFGRQTLPARVFGYALVHPRIDKQVGPYLDHSLRLSRRLSINMLVAIDISELREIPRRCA